MTSNPWTKFFWSDWEADPALRLCSLSAQGLWMRMLCICAKSSPVGYLRLAGRTLDHADVARLAGIAPSEAKTLIEELESAGVFSRDRNQCIYSRRMVSDAKKSKTNAKNGKKGGEASVRKQRGIFGSLEQNPEREDERPPEPQKPEAISHKLEAKLKASDFDLVATGNACLEALGVNPAQFTGYFGPLAELHRQGYSAEEITEASRAIGARPGFSLRGNPMSLLAKAVPDEVAKIRAKATAASGADDRWRCRVSHYGKTGDWLSDWGPAPGKRGCLVPPSVLKEFEFEREGVA